VFVLLDVLKALEIWPPGIMLISLAAYFLLTFFFVADWRQRLAYPSLLIVFALGAEFMAGIFTQAFLEMSLAEITSDITSFPYLVGAAVAKLMYLLAVQITRRIHVRAVSPIPLSSWTIVMSVPVISFFIQYGLAMGYQKSDDLDGTTTTLMLMGILAMNVLAFIAYDRLSTLTKSLIENERLQNAQESEMRQYETAVQHGREMTSQVHDFKHLLGYILGLLPERVDDAISYLRQHHLIAKSIHEGVIVPNHKAIDLILRQKIDEAKKEGIVVEHDVQILTDIKVKEMELCVILGNALENAIEACNRINNDAERRIILTIHHQHSKLVIHIKNSSNPVDIEDELCESSKDDTLSHGFGLLNMRRMVDENKGHMLIEYKEGIFSLKIVFLE